MTDAPETTLPATTAPPQTEPDAETRARHAELSERLDEARWRYHVLDAPTISDGEFDATMRELNAIEDAFPSLRTPDSPTQKVGGPPATTFAAVEHPMRIDEIEGRLDELIADNDHFEFFYVPHTSSALTKRNNVTDEPVGGRGRVGVAVAHGPDRARSGPRRPPGPAGLSPGRASCLRGRRRSRAAPTFAPAG